jgi:putative metal binding uncharacterized protein
MMVDPEVSRLKFKHEVDTLAAQRDILESRGIFLLGSPKYPIIELLFVPRHFLRVVVPAGKAENVPLPEGTMLAFDIVSLAARSYKARLDLTDYDLQPPSLEFRDFWNDSELQFATMLRALEFEKERKAHVVLLDRHPITQKPFLCVRGIREYHIHPQHSGDEWLLYRAQMSLFSIVMSIWRVTVDLIHPQVIYQPSNLQVNWAAEEKL